MLIKEKQQSTLTILKTDNTHHKQTTQFPSFSQIYT